MGPVTEHIKKNLKCSVLAYELKTENLKPHKADQVISSNLLTLPPSMAATFASPHPQGRTNQYSCLCGCRDDLHKCKYLFTHFAPLHNDGPPCKHGKESYIRTLALHHLFEEDTRTRKPVDIPVRDICCGKCYSRGLKKRATTYRRVGGSREQGFAVLQSCVLDDENRDPNSPVEPHVMVATVASVKHRYWERPSVSAAAEKEAQKLDADTAVFHAGNIVRAWEDCHGRFSSPLVNLDDLNSECTNSGGEEMRKICCMCLLPLTKDKAFWRAKDLNEQRNVVGRSCPLRVF